MTNEQTASATGPMDMGVVLNDLEAWHTRAIIRMFYPNTAASVSISMPETIAAFHKSVPTLTFIPGDQREMVQKTIFMMRDAVAALVAQGISGRVPDYGGFIQFQKNYDELVQVVRRAGAARPAVNDELKSVSPTSPPPAASTTKGADPMIAFTSAHNALSDDTPLKRYVRGLKNNRNGQKG